MRVNVRLQGLEKAIRNIQDYEVEKKEDVKNIIKDTALQIQANAKQRSPVLSGALKRSISVDISPDELSAKIFTEIEYAASVEFGSAPHKIEVKDASILSDGNSFFGKEVNHPGSPAQPFLFPAWEEEKNQYIDELERALGDTR
ncbi:HK97 gp10 family phage protein [Neobacillus niacini]|uniref:HK97-gp10 family putative phage morphogenesis protein n=1 Tax=Neobacillus niacini TaxID=86668 RepID=UPI002786524F|nr:HK97-gp10 family putative phage morphogenesis protein [Neobacillus niacini]MDQ1003967.1 HK97 gp10 family phage protein [Neobacillus niacini]